MENSDSYFDWEIKLRKKSKPTRSYKTDSKNLNSLGIPQEEYSAFLKDWTRKNLIIKDR
ncbi:MAG: hypothetical protein ACFFAO_00005 [Candidatus Hermodarchaeota archaeon]